MKFVRDKAHCKHESYTKTDIDNKLGTKANASDVYTKGETYNKTEVDNKMIPNFIVVGLSSNFTKQTLEEIMPLTTKINSSGNKLTLNSNGTITVGSGVNNVRVSGNANVTPTSAGVRSVGIYVNSARVSQIGKSISMVETLGISSTIANVTSGDVISLKVQGVSGDIIGKSSSQTFLVVEVIN